MKASIISTGKQSIIQVDGLTSLMRYLKTADPKLKRAAQQGLKDAVSPVLSRARANARYIALDGTYSSSLSIASRKGGAQYILKSTDPAAGVKEFAKPGATYRPKPTDKRHNARRMTSFPVGVPHRANAPRVMVPAVEDSTEEVRLRIDMALAAVLDSAR